MSTDPKSAGVPAPAEDAPPGLTWREDGWPLCPMCGEDELYSLQPKASAAKINGCYRCGWSDIDGLNLAKSTAPTTAAPAEQLSREMEVIADRSGPGADLPAAITPSAEQLSGKAAGPGDLSAEEIASLVADGRRWRETFAPRVCPSIPGDPAKARISDESLDKMLARCARGDLTSLARNGIIPIRAVYSLVLEVKEARAATRKLPPAAEQPGKADEGDHADDCTDSNCPKRHTIPAGKAADPRPARLTDSEIEKQHPTPPGELTRDEWRQVIPLGIDIVRKLSSLHLRTRPAQPQAPAEPWRSPRLKLTLSELLTRASTWISEPDLHAAAEHFREHPPAAPSEAPLDALREARKLLDFARGYGEAARTETTTKTAMHYLRERLCDAAKEYEAAAPVNHNG